MKVWGGGSPVRRRRPPDDPERESLTNVVSVLYHSVWEYFDYTVATEAGKERLDIETNIMFHLLIWDIIVRYSCKQKLRLARFFFLLNKIMK